MTDFYAILKILLSCDDTIIIVLNDQVDPQRSDYARVIDFILTDVPFSIQNKQLTGTGRPRREVIYNAYQQFLTQAYHHMKHTTPLLMACGSPNSAQQRMAA